jgi:hypothetical protein
MRQSEHIANTNQPGTLLPTCAAGLIRVCVNHSRTALSRGYMLSVPRHARISLAAMLLLALLILTACGGADFEKSTPTPLPTSSLPGLVTVEPRLCRVAKLPMLRVDQPQGHMVAWAPESHTLAYLAPETGSTWMVGTLMLVSGPDFETSLELAKHAAGHLTWSPGGRTLATLSLRRSDGLYTVNVVYPQSRESVDLFPGEAARTDEWSSQKAIDRWQNEQTLLVKVSCGLDCVQTMQVNLSIGSLTLQGDPVQRAWDWWDYSLNPGPELSEEYLSFMQQVNWSPDGGRLVYVDKRADAWVVSLDEQIQFPLDTGGYLAVSETDWSQDGEYLAVQAEDWLFIFGDCQQ